MAAARSLLGAAEGVRNTLRLTEWNLAWLGLAEFGGIGYLPADGLAGCGVGQLLCAMHASFATRFQLEFPKLNVTGDAWRQSLLLAPSETLNLGDNI